MADYHLSKKGEDFIDSHYREFQGTGGVSVDRVIQWLWWLRESGDFKANNLKLIEDVGNERAGNVFNWAIHKGYLEKDIEYDENPWADEERKEREDWERTSQLETCEACGQQYTPPAPDDWGLHAAPVCDKCFSKGHR
tara:strand:- start:120 stop:533 length:414 start_codon:yes stop_codon:yes gene_type:complete